MENISGPSNRAIERSITIAPRITDPNFAVNAEPFLDGHVELLL